MDGEELLPKAFGSTFTGHMAIARWSRSGGWAPVEIVAFRDLSLSPAAMVFHYGQAIFEGLKAFRQPDGTVALFRPGDHAVRFNLSAGRLAMPHLAPSVFVAACQALVRADKTAVPRRPGHTLYLRPMMVASEAALGVRPADEYLFAVIASPASSYFAPRVGAISVWITTEYSRAAPGGTGSAKCAGNYASTLAARHLAAARGCEETLWLDAREHRWVEELGGMNIVLVNQDDPRPTVVAPPATDTVLDGVTRRSLLELAPGLGYEVAERPVSVKELCSGAFAEAFGCGTAAGVVPVGRVRSRGGETVIGNGAPGPVTARLGAALAAVQEGRADGPPGWRVGISEYPGGAQACDDRPAVAPR